ncbi:phage tail tape measure protein [Streptomyces sp. IB2014 016-6]|uniref:phage tail tape measure protein n=1 Tax=Streptomyces sp. IB2014 016-6 TaxID=2517818 RepID=UPI0011CAB166|nr:phage tail tape measure protein [Streptomyces sp. IB2014 016-6]TXL91577.1 phage tail tape measure protein [Streptomyces sp. IB2014 016-6]
MALDVGTLVGFIQLDDGSVAPALRRTEGALDASGRRMATSADASGQAAGQALGDGITRGADGRLRNAQGRFVAAGQAAGSGFGDSAAAGARTGLTRLTSVAGAAGDRAGDALGDGLRDGAAAGADDAVQAAEGGLSRMQMVAAGAGVVAGGALMVGLTEALSQSQITGRLGAQLGTTPAVAQRYGRIAGAMFADAVTVDFQSAADVIRHTMSAGLIPPGATNAQIKSISTNVSDLANSFELDLGMAASAAGAMVKNGLAKDSQQALDMLTVGLKNTGMAGDDLVETFTEYSPVFKAAGVSGATAMGLIKQSIEGGWVKDTDKMADALKEFSLRAVSDAEPVQQAFKDLGLDSKQMAADVGAGGKRGEQAIGSVLEALRKMPPSAERAMIVQELFGGPGEDLGAALFKLDVDKASKSMDGAAGAADKLGKGLRDNAGAEVTKLRNTLQQGLVNSLTDHVLPALNGFARWMNENPGKVKVIGVLIAGLLIPALVLMGVTATAAAARMVAGWVVTGATAVSSAATQVAAGARVVVSWVLMGLRATLVAARVVAGWVLMGLRAMAQAAVHAAAGARVVATWVLMGLQSMLQAARMAAAWFIALGPIGWVIAAIVGLAVLIYANWDKIKKWTVAAWNAVVAKVKSAGASIVSGVKGAVASALAAWANFKSGVATRATALVTYVKGIPGRIKASLGSLGSLLTSAGRNVVQGLWNGIRSMGGWLKGQLISFAKSSIPGPIAKALGIKSPSKVTAAQGRWIGRGLVDGLTGTAKQVKSASTKLADIVRDGMAPGKKRGAALGKISSGTKQLLKMASTEDRLAARLKATSKSLADQIKARDKLSADVAKGVLDGANITTAAAQGPTSAADILGNLTAKLGQAQAFAAQLAALRKKGVRADLIGQIAQAGVEQGAGAAAALATASKQQISQINSTQGQLVTAASQAGNVAGSAMYGAGIQAAAGLVKGLKSQQSAIERQMTQIAKSMGSAIKKALGIRSPSKVMADQVGRHIPAGIMAGISAGVPALDRTMAGLVNTPPVSSSPYGATGGGRFGRGRGSSAERLKVELTSDGGRVGDTLVGLIQDNVRVRGGSAQAVLGARR